MTIETILADSSSSSPHGQLLKAFEALKKEKDALVALTALQKHDTEALKQELATAHQSLRDEQLHAQELAAKLQLKAVSAECQIAEVESFSKETLKDAIEKNSKYSETIVDLECRLKETNTEKEHLLQRTAALARRDQLQKASLSAMADEISLLTEKVQEFQSQFSNLATRSVQIHKDELRQQEESARESSVLEKATADWRMEKKELTATISTLQAECNKFKDTETILKETYVQTLTKHKQGWAQEKTTLVHQIKDLVSEKVTIETQVAEIAELLEREHMDRLGKPLSDDDEEEEAEESLDPTGTKRAEVYSNQ